MGVKKGKSQLHEKRPENSINNDSIEKKIALGDCIEKNIEGWIERAEHGWIEKRIR